MPNIEVKNLTADEGITEAFVQVTARVTFNKGLPVAIDFGGRGTQYHVVKDGPNSHVETRRITE